MFNENDAKNSSNNDKIKFILLSTYSYEYDIHKHTSTQDYDMLTSKYTRSMIGQCSTKYVEYPSHGTYCTCTRYNVRCRYLRTEYTAPHPPAPAIRCFDPQHPAPIAVGFLSL